MLLTALLYYAKREEAAGPDLPGDSIHAVETPAEIATVEVGDVVATSPATDPSVDDIYQVQPGAFGVAMVDLWELYSENLKLALSGDADSQFAVSQALFACQGVPDRESLQTHIENGQLQTSMIPVVENQLDACEEIIENVPDVREHANFWLGAAASQGHILAMGRQTVMNPGIYTATQTRDIMLGVVQQRNAEAFNQVVAYLANHHENNLVAHQAWMILACDVNPNCDGANFRLAIAADHSPRVQIESHAMVETLQPLFAMEQWDQIAQLIP